MLDLPQGTHLGKLSIESVFYFYDIPRIFTCINNAGARFLVLSTFDDYDDYAWLYLPISADRINSLLAKYLSLREAFVNPEDGFLYVVETHRSKTAKVTYIFPEIIPEADLPSPSAYLETQEKPRFGLGVIDPDLAAKSTKREVYNLHFYPWDTALPELDAKSLGLILTTFQELANSLGQYCRGDVTLKGSIPADILDQTKFKATQIFDGSFGIQLKSKSISDLLGDSLVSDVLMELTDLVGSRDNEDSISNKLHQLKGRVASKYRAFLREVSKLDSPMKLHWGSPNGERGNVLTLSRHEIRKAFEVVSKIDTDMSESVVFKAELLGLDVQTKIYRVKHIADSEVYSGKISPDSLGGVQNSKINGIYTVTLKKVIETNFSSGSEYTKWLLVSLILAPE
ncbi:DUF6575 domain-containing protein [Pseudomonas syringae]|uniref:DUF6575 domain-containing protein n=1 Tax=Pseudomonas syringae TaxID=317 RepID=UPI00137268ED|nr:DUF6575 domain-containing protein [Pseudomonas syringae]NAS98150.1 hypothetical protein [Pseudomonas syringae pv. actinidifoliorum]NAT21900.1 hypothetical protein [Pseudomonas syringae pv. actinidifoliorum]NAT40102.1 hypothetical protein [Pseudomonas syringae pv. actinidifoliorum]